MRKTKYKFKNKLIGSVLYYIRIVLFLYSLPIKLRLSDMEILAKDVQKIRETSDKELDEYVTFLKTYIKE